MCTALRLHQKKCGRLIAHFTSLTYILKAQCVKYFLAMDAIFTSIFPDQEISWDIPLARNRSFESIPSDWCYKNTHFSVAQLPSLKHILDFEPLFSMHEGHFNLTFPLPGICHVLKSTKIANTLGQGNLLICI